MSSSAQQALAIEEKLKRPLGDLPTVAEIDEALSALHALPVQDDTDEIVIRDILGSCMQVRNAAVHAASRKRA